MKKENKTISTMSSFLFAKAIFFYSFFVNEYTHDYMGVYVKFISSFNENESIL